MFTYICRFVYTRTEGFGTVVFIYLIDRGVKITIEKLEEGDGRATRIISKKC